MNSLKDAISRVGRSIRTLEHLRDDKVALNAKKTVAKPPSDRPPPPATKIIDQPDHNYTHEELHERRKHLHGYQRKVFQEFLAPVNIPNLKIFEPEPRPFDTKFARQNWRTKTSKDNVVRYNLYLENRLTFSTMLDLLVELTPRHILESGSSEDLSRKMSIEEQQHHQRVPRYWFTEIPPIPTPLTADTFDEYIYFLTHSRILYKNLLSLQSGLVPDILLYTHKPTNDTYRLVRSSRSYNHLIKYFGFDKNQSAFARELLLVMKHEGHDINIDTINNLLLLCLVHANIRSTTNTHQIVTKYLRLSRTLGIDIDLTTWTRVYDLIKNIFFKEMFLNRIGTIGLPILPSLGLRILEDFGETTTRTDEVVEFIEKDLRLAEWASHVRFRNKVLYHRGRHISEREVGEFYDKWCHTTVWDDHSARYVLLAVRRNRHISNKPAVVFGLYCRLVTADSVEAPEVFQAVVQVLLGAFRFTPALVGVLVRGVIHDATVKLRLPDEVTTYPNGASKLEAYKIVQRMTGVQLSEFEGVMAEAGCEKLVSAPLSGAEVAEWERVKKTVRGCRLEAGALVAAAGLEPSLAGTSWENEADSGAGSQPSLHAADPLLHAADPSLEAADPSLNARRPLNWRASSKKHRHVQWGKMADARTRDRARRLEVGLDAYVEQQMRARRLV